MTPVYVRDLQGQEHELHSVPLALLFSMHQKIKDGADPCLMGLQLLAERLRMKVDEVAKNFGEDALYASDRMLLDSNAARCQHCGGDLKVPAVQKT